MAVNLKPLHSFQLPARAQAQYSVSSLADAQALLDKPNYLILGGGTNTLFVEDYDGLVVQPSFYGIERSESEDSHLLRVGATENWHQLVEYTLDQGYFGLENLALIPGSVGAAPVQNIGAYGVEIADFIARVDAIDLHNGKALHFTNHECQFAYRDSIFKQNPGRWLITHVHLRLNKDWQPNLTYPALARLPDHASAREVFDTVVSIRRSKLPDPKTLANAGSFFKNPIVTDQQLTALQQRWPDVVHYPFGSRWKVAAGWLLERLGLKGYCIGEACVHTQQALVLINKGQATGAEVLQLAEYVQQQVFKDCGIKLEPEVRLIGAKGLLKELY